MVDVLVYVDGMPAPGTAVDARWGVVTPGAGFNLLVGATRLGLQSAYAGLIGNGPFGAMVASALAESRIPVLLPPAPDQDTGSDIGLVDADTRARPTYISVPGVESKLERADLGSIPLEAGDAVYLSGYDLRRPEGGSALAEWIPELGPDYLFVFDPGPVAAEITKERIDVALARADILSLNRVEAVSLFGDLDPRNMVEQAVRRISPGGSVVLRTGAEGCWVARQRGRGKHVPARDTKVIDPTGAGDAHVAALLARLAVGDDLVRAAHWANLAASLAVEAIGPSTSPSAKELAKAAADAGLI